MQIKNTKSEAFISKYADKYIDAYEQINKGDLTATEIIEMQHSIFDTVEEIKTLANDSEVKACVNVEDLIHGWRLLVNNILALYVIGLEPVNMRKLSTNQYGNDNYDAKNIELYFAHARRWIDEHEGSIVIINDLCEGNIEWGDIIIKEGNEISGIEIKSGSKKNIEILQAIDEGIDAFSFDAENDRLQYERLLRQRRKMDEISSKLNVEGLLFQNDGIAFPMLIPWLNNYSKEFCCFCESVCKHFFQGKKIDECIKLVSINKSLEEIVIEGDFQEALQVFSRYGREETEAYFSFLEEYREENADKGCLLEIYNEVLRDAFIPQPYSFRCPSSVLRAIITGEVAFITVIDIETLFCKIRGRGYKVYSQRGHKDRTDFLYKNKRVIIENPAGIKIQFSRTFITRIVYAFYDTEALLGFIDMIFQFKNKAIEAEENS